MVVYFMREMLKYINYLKYFANHLIILEDIGNSFRCVVIIILVEKSGKEKILEQKENIKNI